MSGFGVTPRSSGLLARKLSAAAAERERELRIAERAEVDRATREAAEKAAESWRRQGEAVSSDFGLAFVIRAKSAAKYGLSINDIQVRSRNTIIVRARHEAIYEMACQTTLSLNSIGRLFGGQDHTTVLRAIQAHARRIGQKPPRGLTQCVAWDKIDG